MKKAMATIIVTLFLASMLSMAKPVTGGGSIIMDDANPILHYADAVTIPNAWALPDTDIWNIYIGTTYDALVEIAWYDYYPTNDIYELYVDGVLKGTNPAGGTGVVEVVLTTGTIHEVKLVWIYYQTNQPIIGGGSWYDITFSLLAQKDHYDVNFVTKMHDADGDGFDDRDTAFKFHVLVLENGVVSGLKYVSGSEFKLLDADAGVNDGDEAVLQLPPDVAFNVFCWARGKPGGSIIWGINHIREDSAAGKPTYHHHPPAGFKLSNYGPSLGPFAVTNSGCTNLATRWYPGSGTVQGNP